MVYLSELILLVITVGMAYWQSRLIKNNRPIYHGLWAAAYALLILAAGWWVCGSLVPWYKFMLYGIAQGAGRLTVFNVALNRFRGLSWTYISLSSTSLEDKIELRLFGARTWIIEILALVIFAVIQPFI